MPHIIHTAYLVGLIW